MEDNRQYQAIVSWWQNQKRNTVDELKQALAPIAVPFAYHSGVLENPNITLENTQEIFRTNCVTNYTGHLDTLLEIQNLRTCHAFLLPLAVKKTPLTQELIRQTHEILVFGTYGALLTEEDERPGHYKKSSVRVGNYVGAAPEDVEEEMAILCEDLADYQGPDYLRAAAAFHLQFENIHPFSRGNGRVGRALMNLYLMSHDLPPFIFFKEDKDTYFRALRDYDQKNTLDTFLDFARLSTEKTWREAMWLAEEAR